MPGAAGLGNARYPGNGVGTAGAAAGKRRWRALEEERSEGTKETGRDPPNPRAFPPVVARAARPCPARAAGRPIVGLPASARAAAGILVASAEPGRVDASAELPACLLA